ncbi:hypothetical protein MMC07_002841 [Pseudocyphellaria aurata]|nr:hypothetical protein [Pseudocyphellaria aurata]
MPFTTWFNNKLRPMPVDEPQTPNGTEVLTSSEQEFKTTRTQISRDEFNEYREEMESLLLEANTRSQEAHRQLREQEHRHEKERMNWEERVRSLEWQQSLNSLRNPPSPRPPTSMLPPSPSKRQESSIGVSVKSAASDTSLSSSDVNLGLRKCHVEITLARAQASMALAEWEEMENRSQEAWTIASSLQYEPLIARCHFFLGIAYYGQEKWTRARDAFEFANPCVGVYITARDLELWRQNVHTASEAAHACSIESVPNRLSRSHGKNRGWEDLGNILSAGSIHSVERGSSRGRASTGELSSGSSSPESAIESLPKRSIIPNEVSTRQLLGRILPPFPFLFPTSPSPRSSPSKTLTSSIYSSESDSKRYSMTRGPPLTLLIPNISVPARPRQFRLYTSGDDHYYPNNPLRQGPRLRVIISVRVFPETPITPIAPRPSRLYMPDNAHIALYPQKPFRQGERLRVTIPQPEPQSPPQEGELSESPPPGPAYQLVGYHSMPTHSPVLPPPTPSPFPSSSAGSPPPQLPTKLNPSHRTQGLRVVNQDLPESESSPWNRRTSLDALSHALSGRTQNLRVVNDTEPISEGSPDELSRYIEELSDVQRSRRIDNSAIPRRGLRVVNRTPSTPNDSSEESSELSNLSRGLGITYHTSISESRSDRSLILPERGLRPVLRVVNNTSSDGSSEDLSRLSSLSSTTNHTSISESRSNQKASHNSTVPRRGLRVINRTPSTPNDSYEDLSQLSNLSRDLRTTNHTSTSESPSNRWLIRRESGLRPVLRVINRTPESSPDDQASKQAQDLASPSRTSSSTGGRPRSTGEAVWFPESGGRPRFLESPQEFSNGTFFAGNLIDPSELDLDDTATAREVELEICAYVLQEGSTRQDIRQMVWTPPRQISDSQETSDSGDEAEKIQEQEP